MSALVTGGGGFLGSYVVERLRAAGREPFVARRADYDLTRWDDAERLFADARRVVGAARVHRTGELEVAVRLRSSSQLLERPPQGVVGVVVGR